MKIFANEPNEHKCLPFVRSNYCVLARGSCVFTSNNLGFAILKTLLVALCYVALAPPPRHQHPRGAFIIYIVAIVAIKNASIPMYVQ